MGKLIADKYKSWKNECLTRFNELKANEEELNRIFIDIYHLQDIQIPELKDKDVTVRKADLARDIKSLISYAVGCMFGRYSLDKEGLCYAGGDFDAMFMTVNPRLDETPDAHRSRCFLKNIVGDMSNAENLEYIFQNHFGAEGDNIIPITDDEYFEDDIVNRFVEFICIAYGEDTVDANLKFIADALGGKDTPREVIRSYFLNNFYQDHIKIYQKRPIYWLFSSGKNNSFKCLIYLHRYQADTLARIRTDYVHELQSRYFTVISGTESQLSTDTGSEAVKLKKVLKKLQDQAEELHQYEEKLHHLGDQMIELDLDDGVKCNYAKFGDVLEKLK